jgi:hypothetical protein
MAVDPLLSRATMEEEVALMRDLAAQHKWGIVPCFTYLRLIVTMYSHTNEPYIVEATCDHYKEKPPLFEFIDPFTGERGTVKAYPRSHDSFFHTSGPCICAPFNRKAYKDVVATGPHQDWNLGDWMSSKANNFDWSNITTLGDMFGVIQTRLSRPDLYKGRMG